MSIVGRVDDEALEGNIIVWERKREHKEGKGWFGDERYAMSRCGLV
jgi:hypothetical protein